MCQEEITYWKELFQLSVERNYFSWLGLDFEFLFLFWLVFENLPEWANWDYLKVIIIKGKLQICIIIKKSFKFVLSLVSIVNKNVCNFSQSGQDVRRNSLRYQRIIAEVNEPHITLGPSWHYVQVPNLSSPQSSSELIRPAVTGQNPNHRTQNFLSNSPEHHQVRAGKTKTLLWA